MSDFLNSVKADLLDRRLLPVVALVVLALVAAIGYAVLGGGSSNSTPTAAVTSGPASSTAGISVSQVTPEQAVAETTGGISQQNRGTAHNPFKPLPEAKAKTATVTTGSTSSPSSSTSSSTSTTGSSSQGSGGAGVTTPSTPSKPAKPKTIYHVAVLFGLVAQGTTLGAITGTELTPYENLALLTPLPSVKQPLIAYRGVTVGGKSATFTVVGETILHGDAACLPSESQCEAIDLQTGKSEQLEVITDAGQPLTYELRVVSIASSQASSAAVKTLLRGESNAGRSLLGHDGLVAIPDLRYSSSQAGVLVFAGHPAFAASRRRHEH
jgi:hypothetical protein